MKTASALHFKKSGQGKAVLLLHGWGCDLHIFDQLNSQLATNFTVYAIDFNGFGASPEPPKIWGTEEFTQQIEHFISQHQLENPMIIGHSFGGRVGILLASRNPVCKMILTGSAGIKPKRKPKYYFKVYTFKFLKHLFSLPLLRKLKQPILDRFVGKVGSADYQNASPMMKKILSKIVNEDLSTFLPQIKAPTLLIWGANDSDTPLAYGTLMEQKIPDAGLVVLDNAGHYAFLDQAKRFGIITANFLEEDS